MSNGLVKRGKSRTEEVSADRVERVAAKLEVALHNLKNVELQASIDARLFRVAVSVRLGREVRILDLGLDACACTRKRRQSRLR